MHSPKEQTRFTRGKTPFRPIFHMLCVLACLAMYLFPFHPCPEAAATCCHRTIDHQGFWTSMPACASDISSKSDAQNGRDRKSGTPYLTKRRKRKSQFNTQTCHPPFVRPTSTPPIAATHRGNLMIMNTTLQVVETRNATLCRNTH